MPDNTDELKILVSVDLSPLEQLAAASRETAEATTSMGSAFNLAQTPAVNLANRLLASGVSTKELGMALKATGMSAQDAAATVASMTAATAALGKEAADTTVKVTALDRAMAAGAVRMLASEAGIGQLGFALARVGAASATLAPIMAGLFGATAFLVGAAMLEHFIEEFEKWKGLAEETAHKMDDVSLSLVRQNDQLDLSNAKLQIQIDKLEHRPPNYLAEALGEARVKSDELSKSLEDALQHMTQIMKAGPGFASSIILGTGNVQKVAEILAPLETQLQSANTLEEKRNVILAARTTLQAQLADASKTEVMHIPAGTRGGARDIVSAPDADTVNIYKAALAGVDALLEKITGTEKQGVLESKLAQDEKAHAAFSASEKAEEAAASLAAYSRKLLEQDVSDFQAAQLRKISLQLAIDIEAAAERKKISDTEKSENEKAVKEMTDSYLNSWKSAIETQRLEFADSQKKSGLAMHGAEAGEHLATAGLSGGPIRQAIEGNAIAQESQLRRRRLPMHRARRKSYRLEISQLQAQMETVAASEGTDSNTYKQLARDLETLTRLYDGATSATERWANELTSLAAQMKSVAPTIQQSLSAGLSNAAQAGFAAFNSNFNKLITGGQNFARTMQNTWTAMAESFIQATLRMGEAWAVKEARELQQDIKTNIQKTVMTQTQTAQSIAGSAAASAADQVSAKESTFAYAKLAAAKAYNAVAAIPVVGPALGVAAAAAAFALLMFEQGGLVPGSGAMPAMVHGGEMVLPRNLSAFVESSAASASGKSQSPQSGARPINFTYHAHVSGISNDGIGEMLDAHGDRMFDYFRAKIRKMNINF